MTSDHDFADVENQISEFSRVRNWDKFHQPKNLILAAMGELGELAEILQWKSDSEVIDFLSTNDGRDRIKEEVAELKEKVAEIKKKVADAAKPAEKKKKKYYPAQPKKVK